MKLKTYDSRNNFVLIFLLERVFIHIVISKMTSEAYMIIYTLLIHFYIKDGSCYLGHGIQEWTK